MLNNCLSGEQMSLVRQVIGEGRPVCFQIKGWSMHPFMVDGDIVEVRKFQPLDVRLGDVIVFDPGNGSLLVHRVIKVQKDKDGIRLLPQGDAASAPDGWMSQEQVLARVTARKRNHNIKRIESPWERWIGYCMARCLPMLKFVFIRASSLVRHGIQEDQV
jgi:signal peptidase I